MDANLEFVFGIEFQLCIRFHFKQLPNDTWSSLTKDTCSNFLFQHFTNLSIIQYYIVVFGTTFYQLMV